jgi:DNA-repair protein complementing XP-A cells
VIFECCSYKYEPSRVRRIELNRLKAKAKLREREAARAESSSSAAHRNANNKRPLQVVPAQSKSPTAPPRPGTSQSAPLKRDSRLGTYFEYDLSKMVNSKGGFLVEDLGASDERIKMLEKQRADQRAAQKLDPRASWVIFRLPQLFSTHVLDDSGVP